MLSKAAVAAAKKMGFPWAKLISRDGAEVLEDLELRFHIHNTTMDNNTNNLAH